jgi:hypothetical protein
MALELENLPDGVEEALQREVNERFDKRGYISPLPPLKDIPFNQISFSAPHRLTVLTRQLARDRGPIRSRALQKGWRVLVQRGQDVVAAVELDTYKSGLFGISRINIGPAARGTALAIRAQERDPMVLAGNFTPRFLMIPELFVSALWLFDNVSTDDHFLPVAPVPHEFGPITLQNEADFSAALGRVSWTRPSTPPSRSGPSSASGPSSPTVP